jgi:hypothetical protein
LPATRPQPEATHRCAYRRIQLPERRSRVFRSACAAGVPRPPHLGFVEETRCNFRGRSTVAGGFDRGAREPPPDFIAKLLVRSRPLIEEGPSQALGQSPDQVSILRPAMRL